MSKGCSYCTGEKPITLIEDRGHYYANEVLEIFISKNRLESYYSAYSNDSSFDGYAEINYCPMCGRKLERESE